MMRRTALIVLVFAALVQIAPAQDATDRMSINFSDPSRPGLLRVNILNGAVVVRTHSGNEVIIQGEPIRRRNRTDREAAGLRRLDTSSTLNIEEQNNVVTIASRAANAGGNLDIQVPTRTNLNIRTVNGREIRVENVQGEIEVENTNGSVVLSNVAGAVIAHATNGRVVASLRELSPDKPMSFTSMNSNVDVTLPPATKANLRMRTDNGEIHTDFEVEVRPSTTDDGRRPGFRQSETVTRTINGGGPDLELRTLNGNIYIRKAK